MLQLTSFLCLLGTSSQIYGVSPVVWDHVTVILFVDFLIVFGSPANTKLRAMQRVNEWR